MNTSSSLMKNDRIRALINVFPPTMHSQSKLNEGKDSIEGDSGWIASQLFSRGILNIGIKRIDHTIRIEDSDCIAFDGIGL